MKFKIVVFILAFIICAKDRDVVVALPSYITKCSKSSHDLNKCMLESIKTSLPEIMDGDPALQIPDLSTYDPLDQVIKFDDLEYQLTNIRHESATLEPKFGIPDFRRSKLKIGMYLPYLIWKGQFKITGNVKGQEVKASGRAHISFEGVEFNYTKRFEETDFENNKVYQVTTYKTDGEIEKITINHQYNPGSVGKDQVEKALPKLKIALEERLKEICAQLVAYVMNVILKTSPADQIFDP